MCDETLNSSLHLPQTPGAWTEPAGSYYTAGPGILYLSPGPDVELGMYLKANDVYLDKRSLGDAQFARRGSIISNKGIASAGSQKSFFLADSTWRTNIVEFCW